MQQYTFQLDVFGVISDSLVGLLYSCRKCSHSDQVGKDDVDVIIVVASSRRIRPSFINLR